VTVSKTEAVPAIHQLATRLTDLVTGSDVFTDAAECRQAVQEIIASAHSIRDNLNRDQILLALDEADINALATGTIPPWLAACAAAIEEGRIDVISAEPSGPRATDEATEQPFVYTLIETEDIEIRDVRHYSDPAVATAYYERFCERHHLDDAEVDQEVTGTLRLAGDDAHALQLIRLPIG